MKRFLSAVIFCIGLLFVVASNFILPPSQAQSGVLQNLLDLPAPPPPNPLFRGRDAANRAEEFYSKKRPPADDAPIEDLLDYWNRQSVNYRELGYNITPSEKSLERILEQIRENPDSLTQYLNALPRTKEIAEFVKNLYDANKDEEDEESDDNWRDTVRQWLKYNSKYFSDELFETANQAADTEEYVSNQEELLALARVDWERARPIVERLYNDKNNKAAGVLARWAFYAHALAEESLDTDRYRDELKAIVEDKTATPGMRDLALDALMKEKEWAGRDEWYLTLLEDETLAELKIDGRIFTGLTTIIYHSPPERFVEKMLELLESDNQIVRNAAVRNLALLISPENPEIVRALLPWLADAKWAKETGEERRAIINALQKIKMNESVPGLIAVLNQKSKAVVPVYSNTNTSYSNVNSYSNRATISNSAINSTVANTATTEVFLYRGEVVEALTTQKDSRAVPALRSLLPQVEYWERNQIVRAMLASGGFSVAEQIEALETVVKESVQNTMSNSVNSVSNYPTGNMVVISNHGYYGNTLPMNRPFDPSDIKPILGSILINDNEPERNFVVALAARINELERKDAPLAATLREIMKRWNGAAVYSLFLADLKNGRADTDAVVKLLSVRRELREKQSDEVFSIRGTNQFANAISACLTENPNDFEAILDGENAEAKTALFACARLIRAPLSIEKAAALTKSADKMLATAALRWLEANDSPAARQIILANSPNQAKILGARDSFVADEDKTSSSQFLTLLFNSIEGASYSAYFNSYTDSYLKTTEKRLQEEILKSKELSGIYAYDKNFVRLYKDKMIYSFEEDEARYRERILTKDEFEELRNYLVAQNVDSLKPFLSLCYDCIEKELLMLGASGGSRVYLRAHRTPEFFAGLDKYFAALQKQPAKLRYYLENDIAGLEILFADKNLKALTLWKSGADFRVLISNAARRKQIEKELDKQYEDDLQRDDSNYSKAEEENEKRRRQREYEHLSWRQFTGETVGGLTEPPAANDAIPVRDNFSIRASSEQWKLRGANVEVRWDGENLIKIAGGKETRIAEGFYSNPVVSANGKWLVATKYGRGEVEISLVRINLVTGKESKIKLADEYIMQAVVFLPSSGKFLLAPGGYYDGGIDAEGVFFLLDAETGAVQEAKGDFRPLVQQTFRPLQPTGTPDEFWAAIPDAEKNETEIGIYNAKTFSFKPLMKIPRIRFDSMQIWADAGKIYFTYEGHLLALPLPK